MPFNTGISASNDPLFQIITMYSYRTGTNQPKSFPYHNPSFEPTPPSPLQRNHPSFYPQNTELPSSRHPPSHLYNQQQTQKTAEIPRNYNGSTVWNRQEYPFSNSNAETIPSRYPFPEDKKKKQFATTQDDRRGSTGLTYQDNIEPLAGQRRSESIMGIRQKVTHQQINNKNGLPPYRQTPNFATVQNTKIPERSTSPSFYTFNAQSYGIYKYATQHDRKRNERQQLTSRPKYQDPIGKCSSNVSAPRDANFKEKYQEVPHVSALTLNNDNKSRNGQSSQNYCTRFKQSSVTSGSGIQRKDSYKQGQNRKKNHSRTISNLEKQIQSLKLNQDNGVLEDNRIFIIQRQLDDKTKQVSEKNKEIWDKSKIIIEKNKTIDILSCQLRDYKHQLQIKEELINRRKDQEDLNKLKDENSQLKLKLSQVQSSAKDVLTSLNSQLQEKNKIVEQSSKEIYKLSVKIQEMSDQLEQLSTEKHQLVIKNQQFKESQSKSDIELFQLKSQLISKEKQVLMLEKQLESRKNQIVTLEQQLEEMTLKEIVEKEEEPVEKKQQPDEELLNKIEELTKQTQQISNILLKQNNYEHENVIVALKELLSSIKNQKILDQKEQQKAQEFQIMKLHQQYFQKKCHDMNRELKRTGNKLIDIGSKAHQGQRLLHDSNQQILLFNLHQLNLKYRELESQEDQ